MRRISLDPEEQALAVPSQAEERHQSAPEAHAALDPWMALHGSIGNQAVARLAAAPAAPSALDEEQPVLAAKQGSAGVPEETAGQEATGGDATEAETMAAGKKRTKEEAVLRVPAHVEPKDCFVWYVNNKVGWDTMPGTGCAHWVAHQLNITDGLACDKGFTVRVRDIVARRVAVEMNDVEAGHLWENPRDASHIGIVRSVNKEGVKVISVEVEHDSSRGGGVMTSTFSSGLFYK